MTALRAVGWLAGDPDAAERYTCRLCETQVTIPPRRHLLGCDEPLETALAASSARPGSRGPDRELHVGPLGLRTWRCPRAWANDPIAVEGWRAFQWWETGQLACLYHPDPVPNRIIEAIDVVRVSVRTAEDLHWKRHHPPTSPG